MALLFCEGFDGLDSSDDLDGLFARSSTAASGVQLARGRGRLGGHGLRVGQGQHARRPVPEAATYLTPDTTNALYGFETVFATGSIGATGAWSSTSSSNHACATLCGTLGASDGQTVHAVAAGGIARNSDVGSLTARGIVTSGGVAATGASVTVGADFTAVQAMVYADPATGAAWTGAAAASAVFGVERLS